MRTRVFPRKVCLVPKSVKEPNNRMGATRRNLGAQPKILEKLFERQINESFPKKSMLSTLKM
jgi:hypothetical protein